MIFFRKKKPEPPPKPAFKRSLPEPVLVKDKEPKKAVKSLGSIVTQRVLTAEGWRRAMERKALKKVK